MQQLIEFLLVRKLAMESMGPRTQSPVSRSAFPWFSRFGHECLTLISVSTVFSFKTGGQGEHLRI